jgi:hypothetical protein
VRSSLPAACATRSCCSSCVAGRRHLRDVTGDNSPARERGMPESATPKQLLHLVFGGELTDLDDVEFRDLSKLDVVGVFPNYASAHAAWRTKAQQTVDNAHMRYFIVHLHRLLDPDRTPPARAGSNP